MRCAPRRLQCQHSAGCTRERRWGEGRERENVGVTVGVVRMQMRDSATAKVQLRCTAAAAHAMRPKTTTAGERERGVSRKSFTMNSTLCRAQYFFTTLKRCSMLLDVSFYNLWTTLMRSPRTPIAVTSAPALEKRSVSVDIIDSCGLGKHLPSTLDNQRVRAISLGVEADDVVAAREPRNRARLVKTTPPSESVFFLPQCCSPG